MTETPWLPASDVMASDMISMENFVIGNIIGTRVCEPTNRRSDFQINPDVFHGVRTGMRGLRSLTDNIQSSVIGHIRNETPTPRRSV